jgi:hypothetical protein
LTRRLTWSGLAARLPIRTTMRPRARHSSGKVRTVSEESGAKLGIGGRGVVLAPTVDELANRGLRGLAQVAVAAVPVALALYVALAVTVIAVMGSGAEHALVVRGAFPGGIASQGDFAYVTDLPYDRTFLGKVEQAFVGVPGGSTIQIVALPGATLSTRNGDLLADQKATGFKGVPPVARLDHDYLAVCVSGGRCVAGSLVVVPDNHIVGKVNKFVGWGGLLDPPSYRN